MPVKKKGWGLGLSLGTWNLVGSAGSGKLAFGA